MNLDIQTNKTVLNGANILEMPSAPNNNTDEANNNAPKECVKVAQAESHRLKREVGLVGATALLIGSVIGSGIFVTPSTVFRNSGSVGVDVIVWSASGIITIIGGLCYAELGALLPATGGDYAYLIAGGKSVGRYGDVVPLLHAWSFILVSDPMSAALQGLTFASYTLSIVYPRCGPPHEVKICVALLFITLAMLINCISVKASARIQVVLSSIKCIVLTAIIITGVVFAFRENHLLDGPFFTNTTEPGNLVLAFYGAIYAYGGWRQMSYIAEEIKDPTRNIPWALLGGICTVTLIYVCINVAYMMALDATTMATTDAIAVSFAMATWGPMAARVVPICVSVSSFGLLCAGFFSNARVVLAAARQGHLPLVFSFITVDTSVPLTSILLRGSLAIAYTLTGSLGVLIAGRVFVESLGDIFIVLSLFVLRFTMKNAHRPYRVPTVLAVLKLLVSVALVVLPFLRPVQYLQYLIILAIFGLSSLYYLLFVRFKCVVPGGRMATDLVQKLLMVVPCVNELELMLKDKL
ncbi:b(0,+)-type amino acid transporter 1-like [Ixodes scapularis]